MKLLAAVLIPLVAALACPWLANRRRSAPGTLALAASLAALAAVVLLIPDLLAARAPLVQFPWAPELGLRFHFFLDGLSLVMALLITGIGALIALYARTYLAHEKATGLFFFAFLLFMGSMVGIVTSGHLIQLLVFWELTSVSSFLLIGFWHDKPEARRGAFKALFVTSAGGLCLLFSFLLIFQVTGSFDLEAVFAEAGRFRRHPLTPWIVGGLLLGALTKSALWPFHFWLPEAMEAPTPVSAYLHAATMVKAGLYLLGRFLPVFGDQPLWFIGVSAAGLITMVAGSWLAFKQHDLKAILAYSTVAQLGLIGSLYGIGHFVPVHANTFHLLAHACYKGALFLLVGIIDHTAGTRDVRKLSGLFRVLPAAGTFMALAALSMSGIPPFMGFISKELFLGSGLEGARQHPGLILFPLAGFVSAAFIVAYSLKIVHGVFWGRPLPADLEYISHHRPSWTLLAPPGLLAVAGLGLGLFSRWLEPLLSIGIRNQPSLHAPELHLWHGFSPALGISLAAIALGLWMYRRRDAVEGWQHRLPAPLTMHQIYQLSIDGIFALGRGAARLSLPRSLPAAVGLVWGLLCLAAAAAWLGAPHPPLERSGGGAWATLPAVLGLLTVAATAGLLWIRERMAKVLLLGTIGLLVTILFVLLGAPDLALTQFLFEAVMLILFVLALRRMPDSELAHRRGWGGAGAAALAGLSALLFGGLVHDMLAQPAAARVSEFFVARSLPEAGGRNIVNVILVDFRGFDTLGEITVVAMAALGIYSLLRRRGRA